MRTVAIVLALSTFATASSLASAQPVKPLIPIASSDTLTLPDARDANALQPIRLGLLSHAVPQPFGTPGCEPAGRATGLSPMPNHTVAANGLRLWSNLRLTLFGFSRDGCAYDQAAGGGLALTVPITPEGTYPEGTEKTVMFMWGGGAIYLPHADPNAKPRIDMEMRAAVVWTTRDGRSYNVGVSAGRGGPRVSFGGVF